MICADPDKHVHRKLNMHFEIAVTYLNYTIEMHGNYTEFIVSFNIQVTIIIERVVTNGQKCM